MKVNRISLNKLNNVELLFFGDQHLGSKSCNMLKIQRDINYIKNTKNCYAILMGDTVNCGLLNSVGAGSYDDVINPDAQIDLAIKLLTPIKNKILGIHNGNHGNRIYNATTLNPEKMIAKELGVPFLGDTCFHHLRLKKQTYVLFTAHGSTGSTTVNGALSSCMKFGDYINSDIYVMGHSHHLACVEKVSYEVSKKDKTILENSKFFVLSGGYLNWNESYAEKKSFSPLKLGCTSAIFSGIIKDIEVKY